MQTKERSAWKKETAQADVYEDLRFLARLAFQLGEWLGGATRKKSPGGTGASPLKEDYFINKAPHLHLPFINPTSSKVASWPAGYWNNVKSCFAQAL